jgi:hypothetical protein
VRWVADLPEDLKQAAAALEALVIGAGGVNRVITPRGWPHLGIAILDAVFSLQTNYDSVVRPLLVRYCEAAPGLTWLMANVPPPPEHDARRLLEVLESMTEENRFRVLNRQIGPGTSKGGADGHPKGDMVVEVARKLVNRGVVSRTDFVAAAASDPGLEREIRKVEGLGFACWKYLLNLSGVEVSKPDTMVLRWLDATTGAKQTQRSGAALIENATELLRERGLPVTIRQMDHLVWRKVTNRPLGRVAS